MLVLHLLTKTPSSSSATRAMLSSIAGARLQLGPLHAVLHSGGCPRHTDCDSSGPSYRTACESQPASASVTATNVIRHRTSTSTSALPLHWQPGSLRRFVRELATDGRYSEDNQPLEAASPPHSRSNSPPPLRAAAFATMPLQTMSTSQRQQPFSMSTLEEEAPRMSRQQVETEQEEGEVHSLNVAIGANILILGAKVYVHMLTGSSSMMAEALHSLADVGNQALLRVGVAQSSRAPTALHPYGYTRDRFIWALISAVGIFFLGAGASFIHGVHTLFETRVLEPTPWTYGVISVSLLLEGYSLWVATRTMMASARTHRMSLLEYIRSGASPTTTAVMLEDGGAVAGLLIAGGSTALSDLTGNPMWDAGGSMMVGCLLGVIAAYLVQRNRQVLIGRSMNKREVHMVMDLLQRDSVVSHVLDTKTEEVGPGLFRFKAEVAWNGDVVVQRYMERCGRERLIQELRTALVSSDARAIDNVLKDYGRDIISAVGAEVDRLELHIQEMNPGIKWVDLETDRGRATTFSMHHTLRHTPAKPRPAGKHDGAHTAAPSSPPPSSQAPTSHPQSASAAVDVRISTSGTATSSTDVADQHVRSNHASASAAPKQQQHLSIDVQHHMDAFSLAPAPLPISNHTNPSSQTSSSSNGSHTPVYSDVASQEHSVAVGAATASPASSGGRGSVEAADDVGLDPSGQPWPHAAPADAFVLQHQDKVR